MEQQNYLRPVGLWAMRITVLVLMMVVAVASHRVDQGFAAGSSSHTVFQSK